MKRIIGKMLMLVLVIGLWSFGAVEYSFAASKTSVGQVKNLQVITKGFKAEPPAFDITWNKVKGASGYQVYVKIGSGKYKRVKTTEKTEHSQSFEHFNKDRVYGINEEFNISFKVRAYKKGNGKTVYGKFSKAKTADISNSTQFMNYVQLGASGLKNEVKYPSSLKIQSIYAGTFPLDETEKNDPRYEGMYKYIIYFEYVTKNDYNQDCRGYYKMTLYGKMGERTTGNPLKMEFTNSIAESYISRTPQTFVEGAQHMINI